MATEIPPGTSIRLTKASFNQMGRAGDCVAHVDNSSVTESLSLTRTIICPIMLVIFPILSPCRNYVLVVFEI
jgi:hypothetical protein